eukprot:TRINITY_DN72555_c0_g1_i1.p1 TRINITY_DN72555_c0_g1~~TRINITY_DN72555_c0_g1_i1.p1  ORF type:complete len:379 (-),score=84.14 TRINITY_DN72555_c0_g1_i1:8-1144(-)
MGASCSSLQRAMQPSSPSLPPAGEPSFGPLPEQPDSELTSASSCDVLTTANQVVKGTWGRFTAEAFYRPLPGASAERLIRHILIHALDLSKWAQKEGEQLEEVELLGEGSYARVLGLQGVAAKIISDRERPWVHAAAVKNSLEADRHGLGPCIFGHGTVEQLKGGHFKGTVIFMERLAPSGEDWSATDMSKFLENMQCLSRLGFHNDVKLPNILRRGGLPVLIDFDLMSQWCVKVAITSSCIEHDFQSLLEPLGEVPTQQFREYYDLFVFSLTLHDGRIYRAVLARLTELWKELEELALKPLQASLDEEKQFDIPFEVLIRVPLQGVSVHLLDLKGNLFVHIAGVGATSLPEACAGLPQLLRSQGVYWPSDGSSVEEN